MLEKVTKITSVGSVLLVLLGVFNLQQRYYWFEIKIFDYLDASEILLSFSEILMTVFFCLVITGLILSAKAGADAGQAAVNNPGEHVTLTTVIKNASSTTWYYTFSTILLISTFLWSCLTIYYFVDAKEIAHWNALWYDGLYVVAIISGLLANYFLNRSSNLAAKISAPESITFIWSTFIGLVVLFTFRNYFTYSLKEEGVAKYKMEVTFNDKTKLCTGNNIIYIDQSRNFLFFRERSTQQNIIVPLENVKDIKMQQLHDGL